MSMTAKEAIKSLIDIKKILVDELNSIFKQGILTEEESFPAIAVAIAALRDQESRVAGDAEKKKAETAARRCERSKHDSNNATP